MKFALIIILICSLIFLSSCLPSVPDDFDFVLSIDETFFPIKISTISNEIFHYVSDEGFITEELNLTKEEREKLFIEFEDIFLNYPSSFKLKREMIDDGNYTIRIWMNGSNKDYFFQGEDGCNDEVAKELLTKVHMIIDEIEKNRK